MLYTAPQIRVLGLLSLTLLVGLGVREWRAGFPDAADRLEGFDREEPLPAGAARAADRDPSRPRIRDRRPRPRRLPPRHRRTPGRCFRWSLSTSIAPTRPSSRGCPASEPGLAQRIVEERERRGRFESPEALRYVLGMGPKKLAAIRRFITVSEWAAARGRAAPAARRGLHRRHRRWRVASAPRAATCSAAAAVLLADRRAREPPASAGGTGAGPGRRGPARGVARRRARPARRALARRALGGTLSIEGRLAEEPVRWTPDRTRLLLDVDALHEGPERRPAAGRVQLTDLRRARPPLGEGQRVLGERPAASTERASGIPAASTTRRISGARASCWSGAAGRPDHPADAGRAAVAGAR